MEALSVLLVASRLTERFASPRDDDDVRVVAING